MDQSDEDVNNYATPQNGSKIYVEPVLEGGR